MLNPGEAAPGFVPDLLSYATVHVPDGPAVIAGERTLTFRELDSRARRLVRLFRDWCLEPGTVVALLARNELEYFELHVATQRTGLVLLPLNFRLAPPELGYIVADARPRVMFCAEEFMTTANDLRVERTCSLGSQYDALLATTAPAGEPHWLIVADAPFVILYTSGTSGRPKGTVISNRSLIARIHCNLFEYRITPTDRFLMCLQLFHVGSVNCLGHLYAGSTVVLLRDFDPARAIDLVSRHRITVVLMVPTMLDALVKLPADEGAAFATLRLVAYGGSPISPTTLARAVARMGCNSCRSTG